MVRKKRKWERKEKGREGKEKRKKKAVEVRMKISYQIRRLNRAEDIIEEGIYWRKGI